MALSDYFNKYAKQQLAKSAPLVKTLNAPAKKILATPAKKVVAPAKKVTPFVQTKSKPMPVAVPKKTLPVSSVATPTKAATPKSKLVDFLKAPAQSQLQKSSGLMVALRKPSQTVTQVSKKPSLIDSLKKRLTTDTDTAQARTGLKETMKPEDVRRNVQMSLVSSITEKPNISSLLKTGKSSGIPSNLLNEYSQPEKYNIKMKGLFGQSQPITGKTVSSNDTPTNIAKLLFPRDKNQSKIEAVEKGGTPEEISKRILSNYSEDAFSNSFGMGGIKSVAGAVEKNVGKNVAKTITKKIPDADKERMIEFIDNIRLKKPQDINLELDAARIAEKFKIKMPSTASGLANEFDKELSINKSFMKRLVAPKNPLVEEAKKYKSAEEFYNRMPETLRDNLRKQGIKGQESITKLWEDTTGLKSADSYQMSHRPSETGAIASDISNNGELIPKDVYTNPEYYFDIKGKGEYQDATRESFSAINKIKGKPNADITIYRASSSGNLNNGDWVTLSKKYADLHANGKMPVNSFKVKAKDIQFAGDDINEFGYFGKSQLTDIWNEANKKSKLSEFWKDVNKPSNFGLGIEKNTQFTNTAKTKGITVYRGNYDRLQKTDNAISTSLDKNVAKGFSQDGKIEEMVINKDAKIIDISDLRKQILGVDKLPNPSSLSTEQFNSITGNNLIDYAKGRGYDVIDYTKAGIKSSGIKVGKVLDEQEYKIINPSVLSKAAKTSQKTTAQDALRGVESGKGIETSSILKMRESVSAKLKEIGKQKSNLVKTKQSIIDNDKNVSDIIMMNEAEKQARSSYVTKQFDGVKNAILNDKFYKKELSLSDNWQDAPIYKKGNTYRFAVTQEDKVKLIDSGYSFHGSIDEMANTADMDAETFLEKAFDEAVEGRNVGIEKQIHEHLMSSNSRYAELDEELSAVTSQLNKLKKTNANIEIELTKRTDKEIAKKAARDTLEAGKNKAGNIQKKVLSDLDAKKINKAFPTASVKEGEGSVDVLKKIQSVENKRELYNNPATRDKALHDLFYKPKVKAVSNSTGSETSQIIKKVKEAGQQPSEIRQSFSKDTTLKGLAKNTERATPEQLPRKLSARDEEFLNTPYNENKIKDIANIVEDMNTPVNKKVNLLDYIRTPNRVLNKIGLGKEADLLRTQYDKYAKELPKNIDKITAWSKEVPKESNQKIFQFLDGQEVTLNVKEAKVAGEIKTWLSEWADRLQLPKDNRISSYITHIFDQQLIKKEFDEDLAKIIAERVPGSVYDPFLLQRLGKLGYKEDTWAALDTYVKRATRKANLDPALEQISKKAGSLEESQWEYVKKYVDNVNMRPSNIDNLADNLIKSSPIEYKLGQRPTTNVLRKFRQATYRGMLGLNPTSAMRNLSQGANTYAKLGEKYTVLGYSKLLSPSARKEVAESGVLKNDFIQDRALSSTKKAVEKLDKGLFYMFETTEKINRGAAYWGAKSKALSQGKSESQAIDIAKKMVRDTQFAFDSIDTPVAMQGDIAKTLLQFQSYTTKQSEFLLEMYKNKEFAGLFRYSVSGLAFVYTLGTAFGMEPKELIPTYRFDTPPSMKLPVEIGKALLNSPDKYGNERSVSEKISDITKSGIGLIPAGSQMKKSHEGYSAINQGASTTSAGVKQFDVGGTQAKDAQALLFGKYANKEAKDYFSGTSYSESKMGKEERVINDLLKTKEIMNDKDTKKFKEAMKEGLKNGNIKPEDGIKLFKKLMTSQQNIKVKKVFEEIKDATSEEKKAAIKELNPEEIAALIKIIKDKAKE